MKVLKARINWHFGYANDPSLELLVDKIPPREDLIYERRGREGGFGLYMAVLDGYAHFYAWRGSGDDGGFYGMEFPIMTTTGPVTLKGPWSSRAGIMNRYFEQQVVDVSITDDPKHWEKDYFTSSAVTLEVAREAIAMIPDVALVAIEDKTDLTYYPSYKGLSLEGKVQKPKIHKHECPICGNVFDEDICPRCKRPA